MLASLRLAQSRPDAALTALDEAAGYAADSGDPLLSADVAARRVTCLFALGHPDRYEVVAQVREQCRAVGSPLLCGVTIQHGIALAEGGQLEAALDAFDEALSVATDFRGRFDALLGRGQVRCAMGQAAEALPDLVEAVAEATEHGTVADMAFARFELAQAYHEADRLLDAAEAGEEALAGLIRLGAQDAADRCRYLLVTVYRAMGQWEPALAMLDTLVTNLDGFDNLRARSSMHEEAGDLLFQSDRDAEAAQRYQAAVAGYQAAGEVLDQVRAARKHVAALRWSGRVEEALEALSTAEDVAAKLPADTAGAEYQQAKLTYEGAGLLGAIGRESEAMERIDGVAATLRRLEALTDAAMADLLHGELLLRCGDAATAEVRLRAALHELPRGAGPARHGAWLLAEALTAAGSRHRGGGRTGRVRPGGVGTARPISSRSSPIDYRGVLPIGHAGGEPIDGGATVKGDRVEIVVDGGGTPLKYEVTATRAGRRVETSIGRGVVEVAEVTRSGRVVRTARFMASRVLALVEHPVPRPEPGDVAA